MQRYGYEGYPVVKDGKVVGLLTRRAVDRTLAHRMNKPASSLMDAGEVTVSPDESIEGLQRLMTTTGWGQIPVVDPNDGQIIGIVTRTDLLKTLTQVPGYTGRQNLSSRVESVLPRDPGSLVEGDCQGSIRTTRFPLYRWGFCSRPASRSTGTGLRSGCRRGCDLLGSQVGKSLWGTRYDPFSFWNSKMVHWGDIGDQLIEDLSSDGNLSPIQPLNPSDLPEFIDLISARTEFYSHPTALPTVQRGSIKLDLHRRDFTINTLALRLDGHYYGTLYDFWGGLNDLRQGLVRSLHSLSFVDDPTRMLRAVRFEQRFGFQIEERTLQLLKEALQLIDRVSGDRIRHELDHILDEDKSANMLARLDELKLLSAIHRDLKWDTWIANSIAALPAITSEAFQDWELENWEPTELKRALGYILWLIRLSPERTRRVLSRLKLTRSLAEDAVAACRLWKELISMVGKSPSTITKQLDNYSPLSIYAVCLATDVEDQREILTIYTREWKKLSPTITGHDLRNLGLAPGPAYRFILEALRAAWLDGKVKNEAEEAVLLEELIKQEPAISEK
jgi:tRNA nucleotidyltransferase (CCA-adding enzyme)